MRCGDGARAGRSSFAGTPGDVKVEQPGRSDFGCLRISGTWSELGISTRAFRGVDHCRDLRCRRSEAGLPNSRGPSSPPERARVRADGEVVMASIDTGTKMATTCAAATPPCSHAPEDDIHLDRTPPAGADFLLDGGLTIRGVTKRVRFNLELGGIHTAALMQASVRRSRSTGPTRWRLGLVDHVLYS